MNYARAAKLGKLTPGQIVPPKLVRAGLRAVAIPCFPAKSLCTRRTFSVKHPQTIQHQLQAYADHGQVDQSIKALRIDLAHQDHPKEG